MREHDYESRYDNGEPRGRGRGETPPPGMASERSVDPDHRGDQRAPSGSAPPEQTGERGASVFGIDLDGSEPTEALARAGFRLGRKVAGFEQKLREARAELRQAGQALEEDKARRANAKRVEVASMLEDAGLNLDLLKEIAEAKARGDTERVMQLIGVRP